MAKTSQLDRAIEGLQREIDQHLQQAAALTKAIEKLKEQQRVKPKRKPTPVAVEKSA